MPVAITRPDTGTCRIEFDDVAELGATRPAVDDSSRRVEIVERNKLEDLPFPVERFLQTRAIELTPLLAPFRALSELHVDANVHANAIVHPTAERVTLIGTAAFARLHMPALRELRLACRGDDAGAALPFEPFSWLLDPKHIPQLALLDLRALAVEWTKTRPSFANLWASAPVVARLRYLGLPGDQITSRELKKALPSFASLEAIVVHGLTTPDGDEISAAEKNPVGGNAIAEIELLDVPLDRVAAAAASLPKPQDLHPRLEGAAIDALCAHLIASPARFSETALVKMIRPFCQKRDWSRVEQLLELAKRKAETRRAFMSVREAVQAEVAKALAKQSDPAGTALHDRLVEQNRL